MRIAFLLYGSLNMITGGFLYDRFLVDHLRAKGEDVEVIGLPWKRCRTALLDNIFFGSEKFLNGKPYDLILEDGLALPSLIRFNRGMRKKRCVPIVSILHSFRSNASKPMWHRGVLTWIEKAYLRSLDGVILNSCATGRDAERRAGKKLEGLVAYPGKDRLRAGPSREETARRALRPSPLEIIFAGSITRHKGLHLLVKALTLLPKGQQNAWKLAVAGSEWMEPSYVRSIRSHVPAGWSDKVCFEGSLGSVEIADRFSRSDLLVVPSAHEGFGMVYLEGMGFGLPAIGTWAGGAGEIIRDGENGFLVDPQDSSLLSDRISMLISDRQLLREMSLRALDTHAGFPTWSESMTRIHAFLENLWPG